MVIQNSNLYEHIQQGTLLTCENGWHHGSEHEEEDSEENASRIT
jgi:hypothetical protein